MIAVMNSSYCLSCAVSLSVDWNQTRLIHRIQWNLALMMNASHCLSDAVSLSVDWNLPLFLMPVGLLISKFL
jgi:hypothetical protein